MADPLRQLIGKDVTVIDRHYEYGSVGILQGVGPRSIKVAEVDGYRHVYAYERGRCIVIEGHRPEVLEAFQVARDTARKAQEDRALEKRQALWQFERDWSESHPMPQPPTLEEVLSQFGVVAVGEARQ